MNVLQSAIAARQQILEARSIGKQVGLVPTMGALHEGHLSLVEAAREKCQLTVVTIFVNPTQFGAGEDLDRYPRTLDEDLRLLSARGADLVFTPAVSEIYPPGFSTYVEPPLIAAPLEGQLRPGHFRGVATVVLKLFQLLPANIAFFGQKDFQQTLVVRNMVRDLGVPIEVCVCPTVREADGLAMSSRNQYLSPDQRRRAPTLYRSLQMGESLIRNGESSVETIKQTMRHELMTAGFAPIDYIAIVDPESLQEAETIQLPVALLIAARLGSTRLIDNVIVSPQLPK